MTANLPSKNKLQLNWSDSSFFPWLNEATVLDYFCDVRNPFYSIGCNNQLLKMQNINPDQLMTMIGVEYQLHLSQPPLYVVRKVERVSSKEVIPISYFYILHGVVYQAPDMMSILSSRLHMTSYYLEECLEDAFNHYRYNPTKGYYWDFTKSEEVKKKDTFPVRSTQFQQERVDLLLQEFSNRFPPTTFQPDQQQQQPTQQATNSNAKTDDNNLDSNAEGKNQDQPVEKKMKLNSR